VKPDSKTMTAGRQRGPSKAPLVTDGISPQADRTDDPYEDNDLGAAWRGDVDRDDCIKKEPKCRDRPSARRTEYTIVRRHVRRSERDICSRLMVGATITLSYGQRRPYSCSCSRPHPFNGRLLHGVWKPFQTQLPQDRRGRAPVRHAS
jgi:hypothetical protein